MFLNITLLVSTAFLLYVGSKVASYLKSIQKARRIGKSSSLPYVTIYNYSDSMLFWALSPALAPYIEALPFGLGSWFRYAKKDWSWACKGELYDQELKSDAWWAVGPAGASVWFRDAELISQVTHRWKDFLKPVEVYETLALYGPNVVTTEGPDWQRHRKVTAPPFNEIQMPWPTNSVAAEAQSSIIASKQETSRVDYAKDHTMDFPTTVELVMNNTPALIMLPEWFLKLSPFKFLNSLQRAKEEYFAYMQDFISDTKSAPSTSDRADLLTSMIKEDREDTKSTFSEPELVGNIYIIIIGGHETTASLLHTSLLLLATNPSMQQEIQDELTAIWAMKKEGEDFEYYEDYPKMRAIMALMLGTLRVFTPVVAIPKCVQTEQTLDYRGETIVIPAGCTVMTDVVAVHRNPRYWGSDSHEFRISRWLKDESYVIPPNTTNESSAHANLLRPIRGSFVPFSTGPRSCLGKKFSQVEICTVIAVLLKDHLVELVQEGEMSWEEQKKQTYKELDNRTTGIAMRMVNKVKVRFVRKGAESFPERG